MEPYAEFHRNEALEQLKTLLAVLGRYYSWLVSWCRSQLGESLYSPQEFLLNHYELRCLGLDDAELQAQEMAGSVDNPIVAGTKFYEYHEFDGGEGIAKPSWRRAWKTGPRRAGNSGPLTPKE